MLTLTSSLARARHESWPHDGGRERESEGRRGISIVTIVLVRRRRRKSRKPEEIDRGPEKSHKKERGGKREGIDNREKERGRPFSAFARLFTTASGGNQPSSRRGNEMPKVPPLSTS